jgi:hypothetical protein
MSAPFVSTAIRAGDPPYYSEWSSSHLLELKFHSPRAGLMRKNLPAFGKFMTDQPPKKFSLLYLLIEWALFCN